MNIAVRSNHVPRHEAVKSRCRPINVPGTVNAVCGYRLREPEKGGFHSNRVHKAGNSTNCRGRARIQFNDDFDHSQDLTNFTNFTNNRSASARQDKHFLDTLHFIERTKKRCDKALVDTRVKLGIEAYEEDLNLRRGKLRAMFLEEEATLTREIVEKSQKSNEDFLDSLRLRAEEAKKQQEEARLSLLKAKRAQQYLARCPDARDQFVKKSTQDVKYCNLVQMAENNAQREAEKELEMMWHELMLKEVEAMKLREEDEEKARAMAGLNIEATLRRQIASKEALKSEERRVQEEQREYVRKLCENLQKEEALRLERERKKKEELKRDLEDQLEKARMCQAERASKEAEMERKFRDLIEKELTVEKEGVKKLSNDLRREQLAYLRSLQEFREQEAKRNVEIEEIVRKYEKGAQEMRDRAKKERNEIRACELQKVLEIRTKQLQEKEENQKKEKERLDQERDIFSKQLELDAKLMDYDRKCKKEAALRYQQDLIDQQRYVKILKNRENKEADEMYRRCLQREEEYQKLTKDLLNSSDILLAPHAFKVLLDECSRRNKP